MKPPAPKPVRGLSTAKEARTAQTAASTALPPSRSTCAPASAESGWPAATTPLMDARGLELPGEELGDVERAELAGLLAAGGTAAARRLFGAADHRLGRTARRWTTAEAGGDDGHPNLVFELRIDIGAEDDVGVGMGGFADQFGRLADLNQGEILTTGDREQDRPRALHGGLEQGR